MDTEVTFKTVRLLLARSNDSAVDEVVAVTLSTVEFVRRWSNAHCSFELHEVVVVSAELSDHH